MAEPVTNQVVEHCLRRLLEAEGYTLSPQKALGETGVDIVARKDSEALYIEVIGYKRAPPARAKDFYEVFWRAVSRLNDGAEHCVVALASQAKAGLPTRARQHRVAWQRIAVSFPELEIWLVDVDGGSYNRTKWAEWLGK